MVSKPVPFFPLLSDATTMSESQVRPRPVNPYLAPPSADYLSDIKLPFNPDRRIHVNGTIHLRSLRQIMTDEKVQDVMSKLAKGPDAYDGEPAFGADLDSMIEEFTRPHRDFKSELPMPANTDVYQKVDDEQRTLQWRCRDYNLMTQVVGIDRWEKIKVVVEIRRREDEKRRNELKKREEAIKRMGTERLEEQPQPIKAEHNMFSYNMEIEEGGLEKKSSDHVSPAG